MVNLVDLVSYCDERVRRDAITDFAGARNGLQVANDGRVTRIGAAVDAGVRPFEAAVAAGVDFLIVHHGLFWDPPFPLTGANRQKIKILLDGNCAVYSSHLPLDCHSELGNNICVARLLGLEPESWFLPVEGVPIGLIAGNLMSRKTLRTELQRHFRAVTAIEWGSKNPGRVAVLTGSGAAAVPELRREGVDTLITGELKQHHYNVAEEEELNLYCCGHYATEIFGVCALAKELSEKVDLPWSFIETNCPL